MSASNCALVVIDHSGAGATGPAVALAHEWADGFGDAVTVLEVYEDRAGPGSAERGGEAVAIHGRTLGARTRRLAAAIAAAAEDCGAGVIVLGMDHRRLASRHLRPSLRDQLTGLTALPVLVAPAAARAPASAMTSASAGDGAGVEGRREAGEQSRGMSTRLYTRV